jgi:hypothetical protein
MLTEMDFSANGRFFTGTTNGGLRAAVFLSATAYRILAEPGNRSNEKNRKYAYMGLPGIFEYRIEKGRIVADNGLCCVFHLLHSLARVVPGPGLDRTYISD